MTKIIGIGFVVILLTSFYNGVRRDMFEEIKRQQAIRRSLTKLQDKYRRLNF